MPLAIVDDDFVEIERRHLTGAGSPIFGTGKFGPVPDRRPGNWVSADRRRRRPFLTK
jgi:hypothetical protein